MIANRARPEEPVLPVAVRPVFDVPEAGPAFRTLWISDVHLGAPQCHAERLLSFLQHHDAAEIFLVGDIFDAEYLGARWHWTPVHARIVHEILGRARRGIAVTYIPGNHDAFLRGYEGATVDGIRFRNEAMHVTADGRCLLVCHGDEFDVRNDWPRWKAILGCALHSVGLIVNYWSNRLQRRLGRPSASFSTWFKRRSPVVRRLLDRYGSMAVAHAADRGFDGVICGHIHSPAARAADGVEYFNTGDWLESGTALVEHWDGRMEIIAWPSTTLTVESSDERDEQFSREAAEIAEG